jgi:hypothetical protein
MQHFHSEAAMSRKAPKKPRPKSENTKLRGSVETDEGPALNAKPGYRNSDELESGGDARRDDPTGV